MSFLESWYPQTQCKHCNEQIMFENRVPLESDGSDHRFRCPHYLSHKRQHGTFDLIPPKPKRKAAALDYEKEREGQKELAEWF